MTKGRPYGSLDKISKVYGKDLVDKLADKDGFITRDVGYELIMGYAHVPTCLDMARHSSQFTSSVGFAPDRKGVRLTIK